MAKPGQSVGLELDDLRSKRCGPLHDRAAMRKSQRCWGRKHALRAPELGLMKRPFVGICPD